MRRTEFENAIEEAIKAKKEMPHIPLELIGERVLIFGMRMTTNSGIVLGPNEKEGKYVIPCVVKSKQQELIGKVIVFDHNVGTSVNIKGVRFILIHEGHIEGVYDEIEAAQL
jgi:hypothetical protein